MDGQVSEIEDGAAVVALLDVFEGVEWVGHYSRQ